MNNLQVRAGIRAVSVFARASDARLNFAVLCAGDAKLSGDDGGERSLSMSVRGHVAMNSAREYWGSLLPVLESSSISAGIGTALRWCIFEGRP